MTHESATWLPDCAIAHPSMRAATERCLDDWSRHWFVKARAETGSGWRMGSRDPQGYEMRQPWDKADPCIGLAIFGDGRAALGAAMLGRRYPDPAMRPADIRLLEELADPCLSDLSDRFVALLALPKLDHDHTVRRSQPSAPTCELPIAFDGLLPMASVSVARPHLFSLLRALLPLPRARSQPEPIVDAVADHPLALTALVGSTRVALSELERLEIGDVIVVDRPVEDRLDLFIENRRRANCVVTVDMNDTSLQLNITEASTQWQY